MGFKSKAAVVVSGALTAGAFATLAAAMPAGAATYGTEQSEAGQVFAVAGSTIVGAGHTGQNTEFSQSAQGNTVVFRTGNNRCVTDSFRGLSLQYCNNNSRSQRFDEVGGFGPFTALQNEGSHQYVQDNGQGNQITTVSVRPQGRNHRLNFSRDQLWRWTDFNIGRPGGGPNPGGPGRGGNPPTQHGTWTATSRITANPDGGNGNPSNWANDDLTRVATIKLVGTDTTKTDCGATATSCYAYTGTLSDKGTFTTIPGNPAPNQSTPGVVEKHPAAHGNFSGGATLTFDASSNHPNAALVNPSVNDHGAPATGDLTTTDWVEQFFTAGTTFGGPTLTSWSWSYATVGLFPTQHWTDALTNGYGDLAGDGNITG